MQDARAMEDLRALVVEIEKRELESQPPVSQPSVWSLPTDLGALPKE
jgi:hypothetical protein